jgi:hypothetical protein
MMGFAALNPSYGPVSPGSPPQEFHEIVVFLADA